MKVYDKETQETIVTQLQKSINEVHSSETLTKKEKETEKKKYMKLFLDEISKFDKFKVYKSYHFFEPLNNQNDFVAIKPITIFEFTTVDEVRNIFNKEKSEEYEKYLMKKPEIIKQEKTSMANLEEDDEEEEKMQDKD